MAEKKTEVKKDGWYEKLKEGIQELDIQSVIAVMDKIDKAETSTTHEEVDEIEKLVNEITLTDEEEVKVFERFSEGVVSFKGSSDSTDFIKKKLERKVKLLRNRLNRKIPVGFAQYISRLRKEKHFSLKEVEALTGISQSYINRMEKGERKAPSYPILEKLAKAYGVGISELLKVAGIGVDQTNVQGFAQLIYSNNFSVNGKLTSAKQKEVIVELIHAMDAMKWDDESKHIDTINMINIINQFKAITE